MIVRHGVLCVVICVRLEPLGTSPQVAGIFTPNAGMADSLQKASEASGGTPIHQDAQTHALRCLLSSFIMLGLQRQSMMACKPMLLYSWDVHMSSRCWCGTLLRVQSTAKQTHDNSNRYASRLYACGQDPFACSSAQSRGYG